MRRCQYLAEETCYRSNQISELGHNPVKQVNWHCGISRSSELCDEECSSLREFVHATSLKYSL